MLKILINIKQFIIFCRFGRNYRPDTPKFAKLFYKIMIFLHRKEFDERKKIIKLDTSTIEDLKGYKVINQSNLFNDDKSINSLNKLKEQYFKINWQDNISSKKNFLKTQKIELSNELINVVKKIVPFVSSYIGTLAILQNASFWYSPNIENEFGRSQNWHLDAEDVKQVRVLIPIDEVDLSSGPLTVIDASDTEKIFNKLKSNKIIKVRNQKISDEILNNFDFIKNPILIKNDEMAFVDTCRCYHYGSRKSKKPRKLIALQFTSAFSIFTPIFRRNTYVKEFEDRETQLIFCFLKDNFEEIKKIKLKKWELKIL